SSSRTTCSRPPAAATTRPTCTWATWWKWARPKNSSSSPSAKRPRTTSPEGLVDMADKHLSTQFDSELNGVSSRVMELGGLVESQIRQAIFAFMQFSAEAADQVLEMEAR